MGKQWKQWLTLFLGCSKITADGDCSHQIKRHLLLGKKVMTNLDSIFGEGNGNPLQCSCLKNPRARRAWWAVVSGVAQSWTRLKRLSSSSSRQHIKKQRHYFANKGPSIQGYGFSSSHVWMWELDSKESWAQRIYAFELWCWRRLLRVPWIARRSNQSILKETNLEYSLEGLMLKLKLQ